MNSNPAEFRADEATLVIIDTREAIAVAPA